jgi:hypothetical protein
MFSIGTIANDTHTEHVVPTLIYIPNVGIIELVQNQPIKSIDVLAMKLTIPPDIVKQHLPETFFHLEVREMIIDETPT